MNWYQTFYLFTIADSLKHSLNIWSNWFAAFSIIFFIAYFILFIVTCDKDNFTTDTEYEITRGWRNRVGRSLAWSLTLCAVLWTSWAACPSKKDMIMIVAGGAVGNFVTHDKNAKELPGDVTKFLRVEILKETQSASGDLKSALGLKSRKDSLMQMSKDSLIKIIEQK